jgi:hypothetical protein
MLNYRIGFFDKINVGLGMCDLLARVYFDKDSLSEILLRSLGGDPQNLA